MKTDIHPQYYTDAKVSCSCGNSFTVGSTQKEIKVEICSACHPFFTGNEKVIDAAGRVERFKTRKAAATKTPSKKKK
jgi:large subunit ribosomal protein L31